MESVLWVHEHRRGFDRSISGCVCQCVTTMLYSPLLIIIALMTNQLWPKSQVLSLQHVKKNQFDMVW